MAGKFGIDTAPARQQQQAQAPAAAQAYTQYAQQQRPQQPAPQQHQTPRIVQPAPAYHGARDVDGWGAPTEEEMAQSGGSGKLPRGDTFAPLTAGEYHFTGNVNSIIRWTWGTVVQFRVQTGPDAGREVDWQQTPGDKMSGKGLAFWKATMINAYGAGGWTWDPNPANGWQGWYDTGKVGGDGQPVRVAPYDTFFVQIAPDGLHVPIMLDFTVKVDAGYERFYKITSVRVHLINGEPVQAPMPRKVPEWIAEGHGWHGTSESLNGKATVCALKWDQIPAGHCGMKTRRDM